ncbi:hypothetical protein DRQ53_11085 [bacterium]|nr:MAG: hypothetical protein DRQ53_11085 [bacterium]
MGLWYRCRGRLDSTTGWLPSGSRSDSVGAAAITLWARVRQRGYIGVTRSCLLQSCDQHTKPFPGPFPNTANPMPQLMTQPVRMPLPWSRSCFVCGEENPLGLRARSFLVEGRIEMAFKPRQEYAGWNGVTHGGLVATVLDEVMTWAAIVHSEQACFAAEFSVRLRRPLPPGTNVIARASCDGGRRRVFETSASLESPDGEVFSTAEGRYMAIPKGQAVEMHNDLVSCDDCWPTAHIFGGGQT